MQSFDCCWIYGRVTDQRGQIGGWNIVWYCVFDNRLAVSV